MTKKRKKRSSKAKPKAKLPKSAGEQEGLFSLSPKKAGGFSFSKTLLVISLLSAGIFAVYFNCLGNNFVFDDKTIILGRLGIRSLSNLPRILGLSSFRPGYRALRDISYAIDYFFSGYSPLGYHISNILYHIVSSFLVYLVLSRLTGSYRISLIGALIFAFHPIQTDSVTYLSGRRDILSGLFYLAGFYSFLIFREKDRLKYIILAFFFYILAILSKEMAVTLPLMFFGYDFYQNIKIEKNKINLTFFKQIGLSIKEVIFRHKYLYFPLIVLWVGFTYYVVVVQEISRKIGWYGESIWLNFATVTRIWVYYLQQLIFPLRLNADYSYNAFPVSGSVFEPSVILSLIVLLVILYFILKSLKKFKLLSFCGTWFLVTLLPVSHLIPHHELLAEHYLYLPSLGFSLFVALLIERMTYFFKAKKRVFLYGFLVVLLALYSSRIILRNRDWKDDFTLWSKTVVTAPECARARNNLGLAYYRKERLNEATAEYEKALRIKPGYLDARNNLGLAYYKKGMFDKAIAEYQKILQVKPKYLQAQNNMGIAYHRKGLFQEAFQAYSKALEINPRSEDTHFNLGMLFLDNGMLDRAIKRFGQALEIKPDSSQIYLNLGIAYYKKGMLDEAIEQFREALRIKDDFMEAYNNLGLAYYQKEMFDKAIESFEKALKIKDDYADAHNNLGLAYGKKGLLAEAVGEYERAIKINPDYTSAHFNLGILYLTKLGNREKGLEHLKKAAQLNPDLTFMRELRRIIEKSAP